MFKHSLFFIIHLSNMSILLGDTINDNTAESISNTNKIACFKVKLNWTRGLFLFFHPKVRGRWECHLTKMKPWSRNAFQVI